jgi:hypothetical protein
MAYNDEFVVYLTNLLQLCKFTAPNVRTLRELIQKNLEDICRRCLYEGAMPEYA